MRALQWLYGLYIGFLFMLGVIGVMPFYFIASFLAERPRITLMYAANRRAMQLWSILGGIRIRIEGKVAWDQAHIMVGNHCNTLDMAVCAVACAGPVKVLAKQELGKVPLLGFLFRSFAILVARDSGESRRQSAKVMREALQRGWSLFIFPEGTRNRGTSPLQHFKDGAFRTAIASQMPIQPFVQLHMRSVNPVDTLRFRPGQVVFRWLPVISTVGLTDTDMPALRARVYQLIEAELVREDAAFKQTSSESSL